MKTTNTTLMLLCLSTVASAQTQPDSADIYFNHLNLDEIVVSTPVGRIKRKQAAAPITIVAAKELRQTASTNIIDAVAKQPGLAQLTTGSGISKPIIRGLGYNRIVTIADGVRQEGQQWGDEHGIELDGQGVGQVEILKGPASLMYGSDAMAGVVIFQPEAIEPEGRMSASVSTEYQTNSGLADYSLRFGGNQKGFVWNGRFSDKYAHAYKNKYDGYVPGTQFAERAASALLGLNREWGFSHLTMSYYHLTPSMAEGERDSLTGDLICESGKPRSYRKATPFQQIHHYKAVLDNSFAISGGMLKAIVGYQHNRRQEFEEAEAELDFALNTATYDLRYVMNEHSGWRLTGGLGGMWQASTNKGEEYLIPDYRLFDIGAFATASKTLNRLTLSGGLRLDNRHLHSLELWEPDEDSGGSLQRFQDFSRDFRGLTGSLGAVYNTPCGINLRLNAARGFRAPNLSELGSNGEHEGTLRYELGNKNLKAEYSWQGDLGIDYNGRYISVETAFFINRIENYIFAQRLPLAVNAADATTLPLYSYTQGDALLKGFEAGFDLHPIHQLHIASTFSMVDARQLRQPLETRYLPLTPPARLTADVKWEFIHNGDHHSAAPHHAGGSTEHHRALDHLLDNAFVSVGIEHNLRQDHYYRLAEAETPTPAYTLLSLTAGTDILMPASQQRGRASRKLCELYIVADNLLDCAYQSHLSRLKYADINNRTGRQGIFNPGRNVTMKLIFPINLR